jgi:2-hydroxychromene-2-carboxylate isomerase
MPASHPFNSLALQRMAVATSPNGEPAREVAQAIFEHVWCSGLEAIDANRVAELQTHLTQLMQLRQQSELSFQMDIQAPEVKQKLQQQTQAAIDLGLFGVPSMGVDGQVFWGQDALPMLRAYVEGDAWFESSEWLDVGKLPVGVRRAP